MDHEAVAIRQKIRGLGKRGRTEPIPSALRELVVAYARARRPEVSWARLGAALTLSATTLQRWCEHATACAPNRDDVAALVPVVVAPEVPAATHLALVSPRGFRIEGLSLDDAVALLERLT